MKGILRMSAFDTYFIGRGTKPVRVSISRKEVWFGAYKQWPMPFRCSSPTTSGLYPHIVIDCQKHSTRILVTLVFVSCDQIVRAHRSARRVRMRGL